MCEKRLPGSSVEGQSPALVVCSRGQNVSLKLPPPELSQGSALHGFEKIKILRSTGHQLLALPEGAMGPTGEARRCTRTLAESGCSPP